MPGANVVLHVDTLHETASSMIGFHQGFAVGQAAGTFGGGLGHTRYPLTVLPTQQPAFSLHAQSCQSIYRMMHSRMNSRGPASGHLHRHSCLMSRPPHIQMAHIASASPQSSFNTAAYDTERLRLDEQARNSMITKAAVDQQAESQLPGSKEGAWKWALRNQIWDYMEANNIAKFPRPVHHRIPNFINAEAAAQRLSGLPEFTSAQCVKVNPDTPQKQVRYLVLNSGKALLTPQPRLRTGFFSTLTLADFPKEKLGHACTSAGAAEYGKPISLDTKFKVDLIIVGSSCVDRNGCRLGKGEGFAELEYGVLRWMGAIDENTPVVTTVHDCQVFPDINTINPDLMCDWDVPVDIIVTPTQVIRTTPARSKPPGILWHKLSPQKLSQIRILQDLKARIEAETGVKLPTGPDEVLPPLAKRENRGGRQGGRGSRGRGGGGRGRGQARPQADAQAQTPQA